MLDANMVVSLQSKPLEYLDDSSLEGQRIGSVQGFSYVDIEGMIPPSQSDAHRKLCC